MFRQLRIRPMRKLRYRKMHMSITDIITTYLTAWILCRMEHLLLNRRKRIVNLWVVIWRHSLLRKKMMRSMDT